jgi:hypothetical protein
MSHPSNHRYVLKGFTPVPCPDLETWARQFEKIDSRIIRQEFVGSLYWVSTVFLAIDHSFGMSAPALFESAVVLNRHVEGEDPEWSVMERYSTYAEAVEGHENIVNRLKESG